MKHKGNIPLILGFLLILSGALLFAGSEFLAARNQKVAEDTAGRILALLPPVSQGIPENYSNPDMPALELDGTDYTAVLQIPAFGISLPVESAWGDGKCDACPRRYWGSAYNRSLIIGGSPAKGQFDFCARLDIGDKITLTDMAGARFSYEVVRIDRRSQAGIYELSENTPDLVLFVRDSASVGYIIVRCALTPGM